MFNYVVSLLLCHISAFHHHPRVLILQGLPFRLFSVVLLLFSSRSINHDNILLTATLHRDFALASFTYLRKIKDLSRLHWTWSDLFSISVVRLIWNFVPQLFSLQVIHSVQVTVSFRVTLRFYFCGIPKIQEKSGQKVVFSEKKIGKYNWERLVTLEATSRY